jgi:hypothetical protein
LIAIGAYELIVVIAIAIVWIYPWWKIFHRTGKPKWLAFLMPVTPLNLILLYWFAFTEWKLMEE